MILKQCPLAIATTIALLALPPGIRLATADDRSPSPEFGPVLSMDQLILVVLQTYPETEVAVVRLRNNEDWGFIYEVELEDDRELYMEAHTGEILAIED